MLLPKGKTGEFAQVSQNLTDNTEGYNVYNFRWEEVT